MQEVEQTSEIKHQGLQTHFQWTYARSGLAEKQCFLARIWSICKCGDAGEEGMWSALAGCAFWESAMGPQTVLIASDLEFYIPHNQPLCVTYRSRVRMSTAQLDRHVV